MLPKVFKGLVFLAKKIQLQLGSVPSRGDNSWFKGTVSLANILLPQLGSIAKCVDNSCFIGLV